MIVKAPVSVIQQLKAETQRSLCIRSCEQRDRFANAVTQTQVCEVSLMQVHEYRRMTPQGLVTVLPAMNPCHDL